MFQNILVMSTWAILAYTVCTGNLSNSSKLISNKALIAETAVWPNFFLMNIFFALTGSKLFIII